MEILQSQLLITSTMSYYDIDAILTDAQVSLFSMVCAPIESF